MGSNCCKGDAAGRPIRSTSSIYSRSRAGAALDDRFTTSHDATGVRLTVSAARTGDTDVYTLQASNAAGTDTSRVRLEVSSDEAPTGEDPPTFLRRLQDLTVKVGTRTRFLVEIVSSTECKVTWFRNERRLLEAERVSLARDGNFWCADVAAVSVDDAGRWTCTAENVGGRASCSAHLNVLVPKAYKRPEFVEELRALLTEQGTVSLECKVVGVPTPVLRWFKDSREIKAGDVFALTANAEDPTSLGTYTCEAVNCMGRAYSSSKVHVVGRGSREGSSRPSSSLAPEPPPIFTKELEDQFIKITEPLTLSCHIVVPPWPRSVVWYNKEGKVEPSDRYHVLEDGAGGYLLEIGSAEWPDEGEWKCVACSSGGRIGISTCYVTMDVPKNYRKPRFMENLQAVLTEEGLVSFECKVVGFPTPILSWFKDGQELKPGDVYQLTGTNSLGSYCCIARNCMGQASSSAELTVEDIQNQLNEEEKHQLFQAKNQAPKFIQGLKSVEAKIDEPFRFTVKVAIPPEPSVLWYRDDQPVDECSRCHHGKEERGAFYLDIQKLEFLDQAEWKCVAMNDFGHSVTSCFLKLIIPRHYKKPRFLENLQAILSDEGAVNLECKVIGVPQPVLKWYKDGEELKPGDIHRIISGQDGTCCLGTYTCEAQNCMGIAASSASLLGFDDSMKAKKKKAEELELQRNLSLSTIHEERTSQMYDTPVGDITLNDDKGEISFSFDGKEVSVSLYETPDLTEEEALQIVEMYADQLSENITEHNVVELPPLRFVKETSTSGNLLMEAVIIDVSPDYFQSPDEDLRTEADVEDISIADENAVSLLSLDKDDTGGDDYLEKTMALLSDEKSDIPIKLGRKKSDSQRSVDDFYSLSRDQSLSEEKRDDDTQPISESDMPSFASAHSSSKPKSKSSKPSDEDGQQSSEPTKTILFKDEAKKHSLEIEKSPAIKPKRERRSSRSSRQSSSGSETSVSKLKDEILSKPSLEFQTLKKPHMAENEFKQKVVNVSKALSKIINDIQIIERDIILKSELMSSAATASRSLEIISSLISPLSEIHSVADAAKEAISDLKEVSSLLFNNLPRPLKTLQQSLSLIEKCIDMESDGRTLVKKTCVAFIETCGSDIQQCLSEISDITAKDYLTTDPIILTEIESTTTEIRNIIKFSSDTIKARNLISAASDITIEEPSQDVKHLRDTQKALFELRNPLNSLISIAAGVDVSKTCKSEVLLNDMSGTIQDLQNALEQIEMLSVKESTSSLKKYNTEIIDTVMDSVVKLRTSFEELPTEAKSENKVVITQAISSIKENLNKISLQIDAIEANLGAFDILASDNKLDVLQKIAQTLIALENNLPRLDTMPELKNHVIEFHKDLTKTLENVIESNESKKYFSFLEICDGVNRINSAIKNLDIDQVMYLTSLFNTIKIIKDQFIRTVFDSELNCSVLTNISNILIVMQEAINNADEISMHIDSEHVQDVTSKAYPETTAGLLTERIEQTIAAIENVKALESLRGLQVNIAPTLQKICPVLVDLKENIAAMKVTHQEEHHISEMSAMSSIIDTLATPLCELNLNIRVLSQQIIENIESMSEYSEVVATLAQPLHELQRTLEILQQDVISQYGDFITPQNLNIKMVEAVHDLQSCIIMIREQALVEGADDMSTLEDISGIKTTADTLPSDHLILPTVEETVTDIALLSFDQDQPSSTTGQALQSLNEHIITLQSPEIIDALDILSEVSDFTSLKSFIVSLGELHTAIEEVLHPIPMEETNQIINLTNPSKLTCITEPIQELQHSLSVLDINNIPIYENILEIPTEKIHSLIESLTDFKEHLDRCMLVVFPALQSTDKTLEIATKIGILREVCENLRESIEISKNIKTFKLPEQVKALEVTINNLLNATDVSKGIKIDQVKSITEELYGIVNVMREEIIQFTPQSSKQLAHEAKLIETIDEVQRNIAILEQYDFIDLSKVLDISPASLQVARELESDSLAQISDIVDNAVNVVQDAQEASLADHIIVEDFFKTCKNEFTILRYLISKQPTHKKIVRLLEEFKCLQSIIMQFKINKPKLNLSDNVNTCLSTFFNHADDCLENIQNSLVKIVDSQAELLINEPLEKIKISEILLKEITAAQYGQPMQDAVKKLIKIINTAEPLFSNIHMDVINELTHSDAHIKKYKELIDPMEEFIAFLKENISGNEVTETNNIFETLLNCIEKYQDYKDSNGTGGSLIVIKCLSECVTVLQEKLLEVKIEDRKIEDRALKEALSEMLEPLQALQSQLLNVQEQILHGVSEQSLKIDFSTTESLVKTMTEKHKTIIEKIESNLDVVANDDMSLIVELDKGIHSIKESLKTLEDVEVVQIVKDIVRPVEEIELSLQNYLPTEHSQLSTDTVHQIIQHIDQYIELIEIVEEISAVIRIEDINETMDIAKQLREKLISSEITTAEKDGEEKLHEVNKEQAKLAHKLQNALCSLHVQVLEHAHELAPEISTEVLERIAKVTNQLHADLVVVTGIQVPLQPPVELLEVVEIEKYIEDQENLDIINKETVTAATGVQVKELIERPIQSYFATTEMLEKNIAMAIDMAASKTLEIVPTENVISLPKDFADTATEIVEVENMSEGNILEQPTNMQEGTKITSSPKEENASIHNISSDDKDLEKTIHSATSVDIGSQEMLVAKDKSEVTLGDVNMSEGKILEQPTNMQEGTKITSSPKEENASIHNISSDDKDLEKTLHSATSVDIGSPEMLVAKDESQVTLGDVNMSEGKILEQPTNMQEGTKITSSPKEENASIHNISSDDKDLEKTIHSATSVDIGSQEMLVAKDKSEVTLESLIHCIEEYLSQDVTELITKLSNYLNATELIHSIDIAQRLRKNIVVSKIEIEDNSATVSDEEVSLQQAHLYQELHTALLALEDVSLDSLAEFAPIDRNALVKVLQISTDLRVALCSVRNKKKSEENGIRVEPSEIKKTEIEQLQEVGGVALIQHMQLDAAEKDESTIRKDVQNIDKHVNAEVISSEIIPICDSVIVQETTEYESLEVKRNIDENIQEIGTAEPTTVASPSNIRTETSNEVLWSATKEHKGFIHHLEEITSGETSELLSEIVALTNSDDLKDSIQLAQSLRESLITVVEETALLEEVKAQRVEMAQKLQYALTALHNRALDSAEEIISLIKPDSLARVSEVITHLQNYYDSVIKTDLNQVLNLAEEVEQHKENPMDQLKELLQQVSEKIAISVKDADDTESLNNVLDEVQTVIIKLKRDYDGLSNDTLNETIEDLECSVRSVQLQIYEESPPDLLKEACDTLQLLVNNMIETQDVCITDIDGLEESIEIRLQNCATESEGTIQLLELASLSEHGDDGHLCDIIKSLNVLKDTLKSLKDSFTTNADVLIERGVLITQNLDLLEEKVFSLEKDLIEANIKSEGRDSILTAIHSVFGNISNMRGTIVSIQKRYMFENYGKPSEMLLKSIRNITAICEIDNKHKNNYKIFSKALRKVLNHFEDIKFYINLDKTARLPSDAAFTKIILKDLKSNVNDILVPEALLLGSETINKVNNLLEYLDKNLSNIEPCVTLEVKQKIPIFQELSLLLYNLTEYLKKEKFNVHEQDIQSLEEEKQFNSIPILDEEALKYAIDFKQTDVTPTQNIGGVSIFEGIETAISRSNSIKTEDIINPAQMRKEVCIQDTVLQANILQIASDLVSEVTSEAIARVQSINEINKLEENVNTELEFYDSDAQELDIDPLTNARAATEVMQEMEFEQPSTDSLQILDAVITHHEEYAPISTAKKMDEIKEDVNDESIDNQKQATDMELEGMLQVAQATKDELSVEEDEIKHNVYPSTSKQDLELLTSQEKKDDVLIGKLGRELKEIESQEDVNEIKQRAIESQITFSDSLKSEIVLDETVGEDEISYTAELTKERTKSSPTKRQEISVFSEKVTVEELSITEQPVLAQIESCKFEDVKEITLEVMGEKNEIEKVGDKDMNKEDNNNLDKQMLSEAHLILPSDTEEENIATSTEENDTKDTDLKSIAKEEGAATSTMMERKNDEGNIIAIEIEDKPCESITKLVIEDLKLESVAKYMETEEVISRNEKELQGIEYVDEVVAKQDCNKDETKHKTELDNIKKTESETLFEGKRLEKEEREQGRAINFQKDEEIAKDHEGGEKLYTVDKDDDEVEKVDDNKKHKEGETGLGDDMIKKEIIVSEINDIKGKEDSVAISKKETTDKENDAKNVKEVETVSQVEYEVKELDKQRDTQSEKEMSVKAAEEKLEDWVKDEPEGDHIVDRKEKEKPDEATDTQYLSEVAVTIKEQSEAIIQKEDKKEQAKTYIEDREGAESKDEAAKQKVEETSNTDIEQIEEEIVREKHNENECLSRKADYVKEHAVSEAEEIQKISEALSEKELRQEEDVASKNEENLDNKINKEKNDVETPMQKEQPEEVKKEQENSEVIKEQGNTNEKDISKKENEDSKCQIKKVGTEAKVAKEKEVLETKEIDKEGLHKDEEEKKGKEAQATKKETKAKFKKGQEKSEDVKVKETKSEEDLAESVQENNEIQTKKQDAEAKVVEQKGISEVRKTEVKKEKDDQEFQALKEQKEEENSESIREKALKEQNSNAEKEDVDKVKDSNDDTKNQFQKEETEAKAKVEQEKMVAIFKKEVKEVSDTVKEELKDLGDKDKKEKNIQMMEEQEIAAFEFAKEEQEKTESQNEKSLTEKKEKSEENYKHTDDQYNLKEVEAEGGENQESSEALQVKRINVEQDTEIIVMEESETSIKKEQAESEAKEKIKKSENIVKNEINISEEVKVQEEQETTRVSEKKMIEDKVKIEKEDEKEKQDIKLQKRKEQAEVDANEENEKVEAINENEKIEEKVTINKEKEDMVVQLIREETEVLTKEQDITPVANKVKKEEKERASNEKEHIDNRIKKEEAEADANEDQQKLDSIKEKSVKGAKVKALETEKEDSVLYTKNEKAESDANVQKEAEAAKAEEKHSNTAPLKDQGKEKETALKTKKEDLGKKAKKIKEAKSKTDQEKTETVKGKDEKAEEDKSRKDKEDLDKTTQAHLKIEKAKAEEEQEKTDALKEKEKKVENNRPSNEKEYLDKKENHESEAQTKEEEAQPKAKEKHERDEHIKKIEEVRGRKETEDLESLKKDKSKIEEEANEAHMRKKQAKAKEEQEKDTLKEKEQEAEKCRALQEDKEGFDRKSTNENEKIEVQILGEEAKAKPKKGQKKTENLEEKEKKVEKHRTSTDKEDKDRKGKNKEQKRDSQIKNEEGEAEVNVEHEKIHAVTELEKKLEEGTIRKEKEDFDNKAKKVQEEREGQFVKKEVQAKGKEDQEKVDDVEQKEKKYEKQADLDMKAKKENKEKESLIKKEEAAAKAYEEREKADADKEIENKVEESRARIQKEDLGKKEEEEREAKTRKAQTESKPKEEQTKAEGGKEKEIKLERDRALMVERAELDKKYKNENGERESVIKKEEAAAKAYEEREKAEAVKEIKKKVEEGTARIQKENLGMKEEEEREAETRREQTEFQPNEEQSKAEGGKEKEMKFERDRALMVERAELDNKNKKENEESEARNKVKLAEAKNEENQEKADAIKETEKKNEEVRGRKEKEYLDKEEEEAKEAQIIKDQAEPKSKEGQDKNTLKKKEQDVAQDKGFKKKKEDLYEKEKQKKKAQIKKRQIEDEAQKEQEKADAVKGMKKKAEEDRAIKGMEAQIRIKQPEDKAKEKAGVKEKEKNTEHRASKEIGDLDNREKQKTEAHIIRDQMEAKANEGQEKADAIIEGDKVNVRDRPRKGKQDLEKTAEQGNEEREALMDREEAGANVKEELEKAAFKEKENKKDRSRKQREDLEKTAKQEKQEREAQIKKEQAEPEAQKVEKDVRKNDRAIDEKEDLGRRKAKKDEIELEINTVTAVTEVKNEFEETRPKSEKDKMERYLSIGDPNQSLTRGKRKEEGDSASPQSKTDYKSIKYAVGENGDMDRMDNDHYIREYQYGPSKQLAGDKQKFVDHNHRDYNMDFLRPPGYRERSFETEKFSEREGTSLSRNTTIYKAQTIILDSQLRSSMPPSTDRTESEKRHRSKALSEVRSLISERRSGLSRDLKRKPVFSTHLTDRTAVEGSRVKLTCSVLSSTDPKMTWYKNGVVLDNKLKYRTKYIDGLITLEVLNAVPSDSAEYSCTVENENGTINTSANLKVYPSFEASPIPPTFTRSIRDTFHLAENELILDCRIRGQPLPTITWLKEDKPVINNDRYQAYYLADGVCRLAISHPTPEDSGKYTCKAENSVWSDQISHVVSFTGKESNLCSNITTVERSRFNRQALESRRPHFTNVLSDYKVARGGTIGLQVEIRGSPTRVEWLREGLSVTEVYRNAKTFVEHGLYTLALSDVTEKDSGLYTCRAWSTYGNVDMNAAITVVPPNDMEGKPAIIVGRPEKDILISVGEDINISFRVQGEPKPKVVFMKGMRDITNSQRACKMTSDDYVKFTLKRSVVSDAGTYCVLARNAYGCDRAFVTVVVRQRASSDNLISDWTYPADDCALSIAERKYKSVPERIPGEPSVVDGGNNWISLAWPKCDPVSTAPVLAYKVESWLLGKEGGARWVELGITPLNSFDAFNLKQEEQYHFRVTPRNRYGWGESVQTSSPVGIGLAGDRPEFVDILPGQLKVLVGETANLSCSVKGKPLPEVVWMKNGHEIEEEDRVTTTYNGLSCSLSIKDINIEDEARYSCEASNVHGRASTYARLAVVTDRLIWEADAKLKRDRSQDAIGEYPPQFTMRLRDRRVQATYPVRLTCQVIGNPPPTLTWYKDGEDLVLDNRRCKYQDEHFHTLEIAPTTLEDGGVYEAMARNSSGAVSCRCSLVVDKGIRAYVAPEFCCGLEPLYRLAEGEELRISAVVEAYPSVGVTWYRDGVRLRPSRRAIMTLDRDGQIELALAFVTPRDAGVYTCTASNEVGRASTSGKVEIIGGVGEYSSSKRSPPVMINTPDVPYSKEPMFIRKPRSSEAREGDTVIIECEVIGDPKPDVYWLRDFLKPDYYRDATHFKRVGDGPEYRFEIPHAKLDYTGAYSVVARNVHGEAKAIISLQILAKDPCSEDSHNVRYGRVEIIPRFERELQDLLSYDGDAVEFECRVTGNPEPDIRWFHYNDLIRDCEDFESSFEDGAARLKIKQVTAEDEGTYSCEASNNLGKATSSACLVVYPPGEPNTLSQRLRRPPALLSAASTPRSTPRSTPARSVSRTPGPDPRRLCSPSRQMAPSFYTYPFNKVVEEGDNVTFQCAVKGQPVPWATWDKDGIIITPSARFTLKEKDEILRILEIEQVSIEDVGIYRITIENEYGRSEASARLEVITQKGKFYAGVRAYSASPRKSLTYRRFPSSSRQD